MAQTTIQSSSTGTGHIRKGNAVWATARGANAGDSTDTTGEIWAEAMLSGGVYYISRAFITFDTSSIPDNATITAATLRLYGRATDTTRTIDIVGATASNIGSIDTDDYDQYDSTEFGNNVFTGSDAWEETALNASGIAHINKAGSTTFCIRHQYDTDDTVTGSADLYMIWDTHDGVNPEELVITYSVPSGNPLFFSGGLTIG